MTVFPLRVDLAEVHQHLRHFHCEPLCCFSVFQRLSHHTGVDKDRTHLLGVHPTIPALLDRRRDIIC